MNNEEIVPGFDKGTDTNDSLSIKLERVNNVPNALILHLAGYIDTYNSTAFQRQVGNIVEAGFNTLIFECNALNYTSSTGIGSFTSFLKLTKNRNGNVILANIQPKVFEVFQLLGFSNFFTIATSLEEAIAGLEAPVVAKPIEVIKPLFPKAFECPICSKRLRTAKPGKFRCPQCKSIIKVNEKAIVSLG